MTATTEIAWKRIASVWVPGEPVAQPRTKAAMRGKIIKIYTPNPKLADGSYPVSTWKQLIACHCVGRGPAAPLDCPVRVDLAFFMPRTQKLLKKSSPAGPIPMARKPDRDNLDKLVLDVLKNEGWWVDDSRVCDGRITKSYHAKDCDPGVLINVSVIDDLQQGMFDKGVSCA